MKVVICFPLTLPSMGEWSHSCCDVGNCQYLLFLIISFGYCKRVIVALLHQLHIVVEEIYTSVACGCFGDNYLSIQCFFFQLADCCFSCTMIHQLFSHLLQGYYQLYIYMDCFHYVYTYGIFALWFSLNQMFAIKFSVAFATVVERTRPSYVFIEVFARQKT